MKNFISKSILAVGMIAAVSNTSFAQDDANPITTAVPFLQITPDSRSGGMGDAGAAISPDFNSQANNPAKYAFLDADLGISASFTPWLRNLVGDINMYYIAGFYRLDKMQTISTSIRYFSLGDITMIQAPGETGYTVQPNEFSIDAAYARALGNKVSGSVAFRYIHSDLSGGTDETLQPGNSFASDVSFYYQSKLKAGKQPSNIAAGVSISNIGAKMSYDGGSTKTFLPTNLKLGGAYTTDLDKYNQLTFTVDINKLLVPTPSDTLVANIEEFEDVGVIQGMFQSFGDAPGGAAEELHEIMYSIGAEYIYDKQFAIRGGYFHEHETKGNRKYATAGVGLKFSVFSLDASYIIPVAPNNPLANTIRFSLSYNFSNM